jgi:bacteriorhodopsin
VIYFGLSGAAFLYALSLLWTKYVKKTKRARRDRGAYTLFAAFMFVVSAAAFALGIFAS